MSQDQEKMFEVREWPREQDELHICPSEACGAEMVTPIEWRQVQGGQTPQWLMLLRCGECETFYEGTFMQPQIDLFDEKLEKHGKLIEADRDKLMGEDIARFVAALQKGRILPEDF